MTRPKTCSSRAICFAGRWGGSWRPRRAPASCSPVAPRRRPSAITTTMAGLTCTSRPAGGGCCSGAPVQAGFETLRPRQAWRRARLLPGPSSLIWTTTVISTGGGGSRDVAFGDFDGDGHSDLVIVGNDGRLYLLRNFSQGRFEDVTAASGLSGVSHAGAVAVGDYDNDGFLDLFVTSLDGHGEPALYHNRGDGSFEPEARAGELRRK